jgi:predicted dinucleotide-binding enzyme
MAARVGILGTGMVGQTIGAKLTELGDKVMIGTRDIGRTQANVARNAYGAPSFAEWHKQHQNIELGTFADTAKFGTIIFNCTSGGATLEVLKLAKPDNFNGKLVIDISNPLDFSKGMPPSLVPHLSNTNSLGEEVQKALPGAHVVKTLNIVNCEVMVNARKTGGDPTMFIAGNDSTAKDDAKAILKQFGWVDIIDLGDISGARGMEMMLPIWLRTRGVTKSGYFAFKIIR